VKAAVSDVAIWETAGQIKLFTGSYDGFWRLWNTSANFSKEFEAQVGIKVSKLRVANSFLFCGMEAMAHAAVPDTAVGMVHAWNLAQPNMPPLELQISKQFLPYAHNQCVTALAIQDAVVITGSRDGSIRIWKFISNDFLLDKSLPGHAREVTGLVVVDQNLWSSSINGTIRIWDMATGECQYSIPKQPSASANPSQPQAPPSAPSNGHSGAVTSLISFQSPQHGAFVLSGSLDSTIKAWSAATGECVASEDHAGQGVVSIAIVDTVGGPQILLAGLDSGRIVARNLMQTGSTAALEALFVLDGRYSSSHSGPVRCVTPGPSATFYTGGDDGNLMVWQVTGELGL
jgi:WD40 repeat protein